MSRPILRTHTVYQLFVGCQDGKVSPFPGYILSKGLFFRIFHILLSAYEYSILNDLPLHRRRLW